MLVAAFLTLLSCIPQNQIPPDIPMPWAVFGYHGAKEALAIFETRFEEQMYRINEAGESHRIYPEGWGTLKSFVKDTNVSFTKAQLRSLPTLAEPVYERFPFWRCGTYWISRSAIVDLAGNTVLSAKEHIDTAVINGDGSMTVIGSTGLKETKIVFWTDSYSDVPASAPISIAIPDLPVVVLPVHNGKFPLITLSTDARKDIVYMVDQKTGKATKVFEGTSPPINQRGEAAPNGREMAAPIGKDGNFFWIRGMDLWHGTWQGETLKLTIRPPIKPPNGKLKVME